MSGCAPRQRPGKTAQSHGVNMRNEVSTTRVSGWVKAPTIREAVADGRLACLQLSLLSRFKSSVYCAPLLQSESAQRTIENNPAILSLGARSKSNNRVRKADD
jgi:hypothetical protein